MTLKLGFEIGRFGLKSNFLDPENNTKKMTWFFQFRGAYGHKVVAKSTHCLALINLHTSRYVYEK